MSRVCCLFVSCMMSPLYSHPIVCCRVPSIFDHLSAGSIQCPKLSSPSAKISRRFVLYAAPSEKKSTRRKKAPQEIRIYRHFTPPSCDHRFVHPLCCLHHHPSLESHPNHPSVLCHVSITPWSSSFSFFFFFFQSSFRKYHTPSQL